METEIVTYQDVLDDLLDYFGEDWTRRAKRMAKRAIREAYRRIYTRYNWTIYDTVKRFSTSEPYATGTIEYDHTGHASGERCVVLTDGTFPSWSKYGSILISNRPYYVESYVDTTHITLTENSNPGADVDSGTSYKLFRDTYPFPVPVRSIGRPRDLKNGYRPTYVSPEDWVEMVCGFTEPATPTTYTIVGEPENYGSLAIKFAPAPDAEYFYDCAAVRLPPPLRVLEDSASGTVSTVGTEATFSAGILKSWHAGAVIRFGDTSDAPTGFGGEHPYQAQRIILSVTDTDTAVLDSALDDDVTSVYYSLSDILDIDATAMLDALLADARARYAKMTAKTSDDRANARMLDQDAKEAYLLAVGTDYRKDEDSFFGDNSLSPGGMEKSPFVVRQES